MVMLKTLNAPGCVGKYSGLEAPGARRPSRPTTSSPTACQSSPMKPPRLCYERSADAPPEPAFIPMSRREPVAFRAVLRIA
jgi:hypothetical protein